MFDLKTKKHQLVVDIPYMSFAPSFSPDGKYVAMSIAKHGNTHIYEVNLKSKNMVQLTQGNSINTSPSYSPDGKKIVFSSNRCGNQQIFIMNKDGSSIKNIIATGKGSYAEPTWSNAHWIAFTKIDKDVNFTINILHLKSNNMNINYKKEQIITAGFLVESPSWAQNGKVLAFTKGSTFSNTKIKSLNRIYIIDCNGYNERILLTPSDASDPSWSPDID